MAALTRVLLLVVLLAPLAPLAPAASSQGEWWGPSQGMLDGWHVRVPLVVKNGGTRDLYDAVIGHDLDLSAALLDAGWTSGKQGGARKLQAFELDERSVRVVEYQSLDPGSPSNGLLPASPERPLDVRFGLLDRAGGYNNRTQPDLHVEWVAQGKFPAGASRYFMVYLDVRAYGDKTGVAYEQNAWAPLEARRWTSRGTTLVGRAATLYLVGLEDDTSALVEAFNGGRPAPISLGSGSSLSNPVHLTKGQVVRMDLSTDPLLLRVRSDKPVLASPLPYPVGFIPSEDGNLLGRAFTFQGNDGFIIYTPQGGAHVRVSTNGVDVDYSLPPQGLQVIAGPGVQPYVVRSDAPIMLQGWPFNAMRFQLPTPNGAPSGARILGVPYQGTFQTSDAQCMGCPAPPVPHPPCTTGNQGAWGGELIVATLDKEVWVRGRDYTTSELLYPAGDSGVPAKTSGRATPTSPWKVAVPATHYCPVLLHAAPQGGIDFLTTGAMFAYGGGPAVSARLGTPLGGRNATSFLAYENVTIVALHNATSVAVTRAAGPDGRPIGLAAGDAVTLPGRLDNWMRIDATKPVLAIPDGIGGFFAGLDESLVAQRLGPADYRGYLVSVEPAGDAAEPMVGVAAPGKPAVYKLLVKNLAKDARGAAVTDTVRLAVPPLPDGWTAEISESSLRLAGGEGKEVTLTVLPPKEAEEGTSVTLSITASSDSLPAMADRLQVVTLVRARYGVDAWFDRENGPKSRTIVFEAGQQTRIPVVVKNLASVADHILVSATPLSADWTARFEDTNADLAEVELAPGEARAFYVNVRAPTDGGSQSLLQVVATSLSDASAAVQISAGLRMRSDARIDLVPDVTAIETAPGTEARFHLKFHNLGTEAIGIEFNTTGSLPKGWSRPVTYAGEHEIDELEGLASGSVTTLDLVAQVPEGALRGDVANLHFVLKTLPQFVGDVVLKESVDLRVLVAAQHALPVRDRTSDVVADETGLATARMAFSNAGNLDETLRARPVDLPEGASFAAPPPVLVPRGENGSITTTLRLPATTPAGAYRADLELVAEDGATFPWRVNVTVLPRARVALVAQSPQESVAGLPTHALLDVRNDGNVPLTLPPQLVLPEGWRATWGNLTARELPPGAEASVPLDLDVPRAASASREEIRTDPQWADGGRLAWDVHTVRLRAELVDGDSPTVRIQNDGTGDARDVVVVLLDDGVPRDQVVLRRIPPGSSSVAVLVAPPGGARDVTLRVDAGQQYADAPQDLAVRVQGEKGVYFPVWATLVGFIFVALARGRRSP